MIKQLVLKMSLRAAAIAQPRIQVEVINTLDVRMKIEIAAGLNAETQRRRGLSGVEGSRCKGNAHSVRQRPQ